MTTGKTQDIWPFLVIGGGIAGCMLALKLAKKHQVAMIIKGSWQDSNTWWAQGGIASVMHHADSFDEHVQDTLRAGADLCHESVVRMVVEHGPEAIEELMEYGVEFSREQQGKATRKKAPSQPEHRDLHLTKEGGHSKRRVVHAQDVTGREVLGALAQQVERHPSIQVIESSFAIDLITTDKVAPTFGRNRCLGAYVLDQSGSKVQKMLAHHTFLCTGGHGKIYLYTSNPDTASGDGVAMAWRAGCRVGNLEFMQFHPTCLYHPEAKNFLITEALRGEGAILRNMAGDSFMEQYHPMASLAPRDVVARAIDMELKKSGQSYALLDATHIDPEVIERQFPNIKKRCQDFGYDIHKRPLPVVPAAHYSCGGIITDAWGRADLENLWAIGENACTGLHGANRLASNSLLEAAVFAGRAAEGALASFQQHEQAAPASHTPFPAIPDWNPGTAAPSDELVVLSHMWDEIRRLMWNYVGIVRTQKRLDRALARVEMLRRDLDTYYWSYAVTKDTIEVRNLALVAWLTIRCAMKRKESRGIHFNMDHPELDAFGPRDTVLH